MSSSLPTIECPVCRENKVAFVTLECQHKICLKCYHYCIYHNHTKCSLCRKNIPELAETCEFIQDIEQDVEGLETKIDELEKQNEDLYKNMDDITGLYEDLQERHDELWAQIN